MSRKLSLPAAILALPFFFLSMPVHAEERSSSVSAAISAVAEVVFPLGVVASDTYPVESFDLTDESLSSGHMVLMIPSSEVCVRFSAETPGALGEAAEVWCSDDSGEGWHGIDISEMIIPVFGETSEICITVILADN